MKYAYRISLVPTPNDVFFPYLKHKSLTNINHELLSVTKRSTVQS